MWKLSFVIAFLSAAIPVLGLSGCATQQGPGAYQATTGDSRSQALFRKIDGGDSVASIYPSKESRQAQYGLVEKEWSALAGKYPAKGPQDPALVQSFNQDIDVLSAEMADIQKRLNQFSGSPTGLAQGPGLISIPAFSSIEWENRGNCLDPNLPAPRAGDKFQMIPAQTLIPPELMPIYQCVLKKAETDPEVKKHQQQIIWAMRTLDKRRSYADALGSAHQAILNQCSPDGDGAAVLQSLRAPHEGAAVAQTVMLTAVSVASVAFLGVNLAALVDPETSPFLIDQEVSQLMNAPINEEIRDGNYHYGSVDNGVYSEIVGTAPLKVKIRLVNARQDPYVFDPTLYAAQAQRKTQRVTMAAPPPDQIEIRSLGDSRQLVQAIREDQAFVNRMNRRLDPLRARYLAGRE
ncbi:hypothetical protein FACS1894205_3510 [Alphaproteobacteria bacterium]|nr:hypothetical protein FACS1894205_3510 [Alphaproteobacteria bacterium]